MAGGTWSMKGYYSPFYHIRFILTRHYLYCSDLTPKQKRNFYLVSTRLNVTIDYRVGF
jgi:hypothetical protein